MINNQCIHMVSFIQGFELRNHSQLPFLNKVEVETKEELLIKQDSKEIETANEVDIG